MEVVSILKNGNRKGSAKPLFVLLSFALLGVGIFFWTRSETSTTSSIPTDPNPSLLFAKSYPQAERFQNELEKLRINNQLLPGNERLIAESVQKTATYFKMPESLLWCLFFQESRLNHLEGMENPGDASGLGQFSYYSFYEINNQLQRFDKDGGDKIQALLGSDVRPIEAKKDNVLGTSSYYNIPTAVVASALYLNDRKIHLERILQKHGLSADPDLLWFWASLAYNKGTRSILAIWNQVQKRGGKDLVRSLILDKKAFLKTIRDSALLTNSLKKVWEPADAEYYARELRIHAANLRDCSIPPSALEVSTQSQPRGGSQ